MTYVKTAAPVYAFFLLIDRWYQFHRFESWTNTYVSVFAKEMRMLNPSLPADYPWETPFHVGFFGALFKPEKSIFLFDPLLLLTILICALAWKRLRRDVKRMSSLRSCCCWLTSASTRSTRFGAATSLGAIVMSPLRLNWRRSSPCRCCCAIARSSESSCG